MSDFFKSQIDYIFFFYGAAFFLLVPICLFLRQRPQLLSDSLDLVSMVWSHPWIE